MGKNDVYAKMTTMGTEWPRQTSTIHVRATPTCLPGWVAGWVAGWVGGWLGGWLCLPGTAAISAFGSGSIDRPFRTLTSAGRCVAAAAAGCGQGLRMGPEWRGRVQRLPALRHPSLGWRNR